MTAEEYIVEKLQEYENRIDSLESYIKKLEIQREGLEYDLKFICSLVNQVEFEGKNQFELSVWDSYDRDTYDRLDVVMVRYKEE